MAAAPRYKRVLVKLSGESFCCGGAPGVDAKAVSAVAKELEPLVRMKVRLGVVVGGGNLLRGRDFAAGGLVHRATADAMGMLATAINALALQDVLEARGIPCRLLSAIPVGGLCEPFSRKRALEALDEGRVLLLAAGTGHPYVTTDTCAAVRALEIDAQVLLKATKVGGVFDSDPVVNPRARRFRRLTYRQVLERRLGVMDLVAVALCMEHRLPIVVLELSRPGNLARAVRGENVGTLVCP